MRVHYRTFTAWLLLLSGVYMTVLGTTHAQERLLARASGVPICDEGAASSPLTDAFRLVCLKERPAARTLVSETRSLSDSLAVS